MECLNVPSAPRSRAPPPERFTRHLTPQTRLAALLKRQDLMLMPGPLGRPRAALPLSNKLDAHILAPCCRIMSDLIMPRTCSMAALQLRIICTSPSPPLPLPPHRPSQSLWPSTGLFHSAGPSFASKGTLGSARSSEIAVRLARSSLSSRVCSDGTSTNACSGCAADVKMWYGCCSDAEGAASSSRPTCRTRGSTRRSEHRLSVKQRMRAPLFGSDGCEFDSGEWRRCATDCRFARRRSVGFESRAAHVKQRGRARRRQPDHRDARAFGGLERDDGRHRAERRLARRRE
eukprot:3031507-Prymnesium_polylepis.1